MAITRAQQAKQMLQDGGMLVQPSMTGKRPGYRGDAAARSTGAKQSGRADPGSRSDPGEGKDSQGRSAPTAGKGASVGPSGRDDTVDSNVIDRQRRNYEKQFFEKGKVPPLGSRPTSFKTKLNQRNLQKRLNYINYLQKNINAKLQKGLMDPSIPGVDVMTEEELLNLAPSVADLVEKGFYSKDGRFAKGDIPDFNTLDIPGSLGIVQDIFEGPVTSDKLKQLSGQLKTLEGLKTSEGLKSDDAKFNTLMKTYEPNRFEREFGDSRDDRGDPFIPIIPKVKDDTEEDTTPDRNLAGLTSRIGGSIFDFTGLADGGRVAAAEGGIMELARQEMFLGGIAKGIKKAVKGVSRTIKKVAKSPIGKIALAAAAGGYGFGLGPFKGIAGSGFLKGSAVKNFLFKDGVPGLSNLSGKGIASIIGGASLLPFLMGPKEEDDEFDIAEYYRRNALNPNAALNARIAGSQFAFAEGGDVEPVAKKTMPLLDMDGQEMDLRAEGGFVPIGRMEKADDVPARLSKNEFVFTADAVRNAGDGDVDKGAEVMYNMMKNLESGGDVSEESQGLSGARKMFQTSKRLEEVL